MAKTKPPVPARVDQITSTILVLRGQRVILDADLAALYGVTTKALNQAAKRNIERFPVDFLFRSTRNEVQGLNRSQSVTGSQKHRDPRFRPFAFTEHGAIMAATILNSARAGLVPHERFFGQTCQIRCSTRPECGAKLRSTMATAVESNPAAWSTNMGETAEELLRKALSLDEKDRASLAGALVESLHGEPDPGASGAWAVEIQRRVAELEAGSVATVPWSQVRERLFRGFE